MATKIAKKSVSTADNAIISYFEFKSPYSTSSSPPKPGLIILHGGMETSWTHSEIAEALTSSLNVYLPDRRGRGSSCDHGIGFSLQTEINDLRALVSATRAKYILATGSGATIALYAALELGASTNENEGGSITKIAVCEPAIVPDDGVWDQKWEQFEQEIDASRIDDACVTALEMSKVASWYYNWLPRFVTLPLATVALRLDEEIRILITQDEEARRLGVKGADYTARKLVLAQKFDFRLLKETQGMVEELTKLNEMDVEVVLVTGDQTADHLKKHVKHLRKLIPKTEHWEFGGMGHSLLYNGGEGGDPKKLATELEKFFS